MKTTQSKKRIRPGDEDPRHGTPNGYINLGCRCDACRSANTAYLRGIKSKRSLAVDDPRHGTENAYGNFNCRCDLCRAARAAWARDHYRPARAS